MKLNIGHLFDHTSGGILITSGNGVVGHRVATHLIQGYYPRVRVGARDLATIQDLKNAERVKFVWEDEDTYKEALEGIKYVFCSMPHHSAGWDEYFPKFIKACKAAGVAHIVKLSFYHAVKCQSEIMRTAGMASRVDDPFLQVPLIQKHGYCDMRLVKSGIGYTILFPSHLMSNPLVYQGKSLREEHKFVGASQSKGVNYVSPNDVAEVAVKALLSPKEHNKKGYTLTGPTAISDDEVAKLISQQLGETVKYVDESLVDLEEKAKPDWETDLDFVSLEKIKASGTEELDDFATNDTAKVCGHEAQTYEQYLLAKDEMIREEVSCLCPAKPQALMIWEQGVFHSFYFSFFQGVLVVSFQKSYMYTNLAFMYVNYSLLACIDESPNPDSNRDTKTSTLNESKIFSLARGKVTCLWCSVFGQVLDS